MFEGDVTFVGKSQPFRCSLNGQITQNPMVKVRASDGSGWELWYLHLSRFSVSNGQHVRQGDELGYSGNGGCASAVHLHVELVINGAHTSWLGKSIDGWQVTGHRQNLHSSNFTGNVGGDLIGALDVAQGALGGFIGINGWMIDRDAPTTSGQIHVYIDGPAGSGVRGVNIGLADLSRPDVGAAHPGAGDAHGFNTAISGLSPGVHTLWAYAINAAGGGANPLLRTLQVNVLGPVGDGSFVGTPDGRVYRIAGGAPLYINSWDPFGGPQPVVNVPDLSRFRQHPADGTFIHAAETGRVYRIAGAAPLYVNSWDPFGGPQPTVAVTQWTIDNNALGRLRAVPADGTIVRAVQTEQLYKVAGGAALHLTSCDPAGVCSSAAVDVDQYAIDQRDHLRAVPADGTVLQGQPSGSFWRVNAGCRRQLAPPQPLAVAVNDETVSGLTDCTPSIAVISASVREQDTGTVPVTFKVRLSAASTDTVRVNYATEDGGAKATSDYAAVSGVLAFAPGETIKTVTVDVNGDTLYEIGERFYLNLSNPVSAVIADSRAIGTIINNDPKPTVSVSDAAVSEGNSGTTSMVFTLTLSVPSGAATKVGFATADNSATGGSDYVAKAATATIPAGTTSKTVKVTIKGDTLSEPEETFTVNLSSPVGTTIIDSQGVGAIRNDD
jgi:Calx-beta domain/Peptidase family M23